MLRYPGREGKGRGGERCSLSSKTSVENETGLGRTGGMVPRVIDLRRIALISVLLASLFFLRSFPARFFFFFAFSLPLFFFTPMVSIGERMPHLWHPVSGFVRTHNSSILSTGEYPGHEIDEIKAQTINILTPRRGGGDLFRREKPNFTHKTVRARAR